MEFKKPFESRDTSSYGLSFFGESRTKQAFADECDINNILARYNRSGLIDHVSTYGGQYGDFVEVTDYHSSLNQIREANDMFMSLPAKVRSKFENDPGAFLDFVLNEDNKSEMANLGLLRPDYEAPKMESDPLL